MGRTWLSCLTSHLMTSAMSSNSTWDRSVFLPRHSPSPAHLSVVLTLIITLNSFCFFFALFTGSVYIFFNYLYQHSQFFWKKNKLLQLPEPLILYRYYTDIIGLSKECQRVIVEEADTHPVPQAGEKSDLSTQLNKVIYRIRDLLYQLPTNNYRTLRHLIAHLRR